MYLNSKATFRYLKPTEQVYGIVKLAKPLQGTFYYKNHEARGGSFLEYFSSPIKTKLHPEPINAIIAFSSHHSSELVGFDKNAYSYCSTVAEMEDYAYEIKMPFVVILNSWCDIQTKEEEVDMYFSCKHFSRQSEF